MYGHIVFFSGDIRLVYPLLFIYLHPYCVLCDLFFIQSMSVGHGGVIINNQRNPY